MLIFRRKIETVPARIGFCLLAALAFPYSAATAAGRSPEAGEVSVSGDAVSGDLLRAELRRIISEARDRVFPALVSIRVVTVQYSGGREFKGQSVGSGTIISPRGYVLTNQHVVRHGRKFICTLSDKQELSAELVGEDPLTDLAILQLDLSELDDPDQELPAAPFGDSGALEIGDYVMAMGSPFSLSRSVSLGIVSNTERVFAAGFGSDDVEEMELEQGQRTGLFTRWIQHDALINPGNSGGPLVNLAGEIVGVNELGGSSMGFAIPSNLATRVAAALIDDGEVERSWIGVSFKPIQRTGLTEGVLINSVVVDGPAARVGIQAGDVLLALDGESVTVRFPEEVPTLMERLAGLPIGSGVEVAHRRDDEILTARITTEKLQKDLGEQTWLHGWGLTMQEITEKMARDWLLESTDGVLVTGVRQGGPAQTAEPPLNYRDVIRAVDGQPVRNLQDLLARYEELSDEEAEAGEVLIEFERRGMNQLTLLEPREDDQDDPPRELPKSWIGVATQPVLPRLAGHLGLGDARGFRVTRVYPGSEAATAGLRVGDVIVAVAGEALHPRGMQDSGLLTRWVRALDIGETVTIELLRQRERLELPVMLERTRLTPEEARRHRDSDFELTVRELTFFDRDENRWDRTMGGVLVENVDAGGWAGLGGIRPFDLVLRINDTSIRGLKSFRRALKQIKRDQPERVVVVVLRGVKTHFQYLEPDWVPAESRSATTRSGDID
ncbi:MAG: PDZ domain-containing protein [bacterium]|nr:PDZ domain-containing protein [bacterium]